VRGAALKPHQAQEGQALLSRLRKLAFAEPTSLKRVCHPTYLQDGTLIFSTVGGKMWMGLVNFSSIYWTGFKAMEHNMMQCSSEDGLRV
jgi:hypothetical protein